MTRALLLATTLCACSPMEASLPDGGRTLQGCFGGNVVLPVKVVDANNQPVSGATVTATNRAPPGKSLTGITDGNGVTNAVTEAIGAGEVDIKATDGARVSGVFNAQWTCGECDCTANPAAATLQIQ